MRAPVQHHRHDDVSAEEQEGVLAEDAVGYRLGAGEGGRGAEEVGVRCHCLDGHVEDETRLEQRGWGHFWLMLVGWDPAGIVW